MSLVEPDHVVNQEAHQVMGTVVAVQANFYQVQLTLASLSLPEAQGFTEPFLLCTRRTRLKKIGQKVMVGDRVMIEEPDWTGGRGAIAEVLPRQTELTRPPIANADQILLVFAVAEPDLDPQALSRFLVKAESTGLEVCLGLNKCDLVTSQQLQHWRERLSSWGYQPFFISVYQGVEFILEHDNEIQRYSISDFKSTINHSLIDQLTDKITVICGPSGVGKSSLINLLIPDIDLRVGAVSGKLGRGRHTTRHVELFELPSKGLLADTPGFNQPLLECEPQELADYFPEARQRLATGNCQFSDCLHRDEPNCVVREDWERYSFYLDFLAEAIKRQEALHQQPDAESSFKSKTKSGGKQQDEPKLESKKYRRSSRRIQHQTLQDLCEEMEDI
ncbi:small ribosomal subunit biogenesis GTPase RsgA [Lyngbya sp. PCC 8106]|uniref:small ribosomal subunit biogenesis GTPase RsgA n=1 Tax=Lyngbya sp. (strain PCC 8106) TaxID=313612 RepID=UPI0000EAA8B1|nr:small ribosomal subunit biogenesis GTPase RsgA [Lyngbya sp. PCC 8106]EAW37452.1 ribosome-associated GTPase [Lyngbya sp. PCC 8106]